MEFKLPVLGENIASGDVVNVLVGVGDHIAANDGVIELETDKAVVEIPCPHAGKVTKLLVKKGDTVKVGQALLVLETEEAAAPAQPPESSHVGQQPPAASAEEAAGGPLPAGPAVRRLARELGVDLARVQGSGKRGRITPEDVQAAVAARPAAVSAPSEVPAQTAPAAVTPPGEPGRDAWGPIRTERISRIRRTIAEQMVRSATVIPHVTNCDDADVTELEQLRAGVPAGYLGREVKLTMTPLVMKAVTLALRRHPAINASFDLDKDQIVYKQYVNLGVAVDTPRGLVVPNVRNAEGLSVPQLAQALATIAARARTGQFGVEELRGGTFTISNMGAVGGTYSTPIINYPEVALLLVGRARRLPVVRGENHEKIEIRLMMPLSLSYDHRLVDGATAARFLNEVIAFLQSPGKLLLAGGEG
jgi:pyruvate/2-oxoglutarate dehydrogenase complex dihydrolipoamide acyltransferase (E2) component